MSDFVFVADHRDPATCCMCGEQRTAHAEHGEYAVCPDALV